MKKIIAAVMSVFIVTAFSACGNTDSGSASEETTSAAETTTAAETTQAETTEAAETTAAETTAAETTTEAETTAVNPDEAAAIAAEGALYQGDGYTVKINSEKWMDFSAYVDEISKLADEKDLGFDISAEDIQNTNDGMFFYVPDMSINFNFGVTEIGDVGEGFDISLFGDVMELQYGQIDGCTYLGDEVINVNGYECLKMDIATSAELYGAEMKMSQYMFIHGTKQYVATYTAAEGSYDNGITDFEAMLNTIVFDK